ncbi:hypothetical protein ACFL2V_13345 [Pseudomonadota bacterium]
MKGIKRFKTWLQNLKSNKKALLILIAINIFMGIASNVVDWHWLSKIPWYLLPFAPICSIYPFALAIWFALKYFGKRIPGWYTAFLCMGLFSYGVMAYFYYPLYMSWDGIQFRLIGNMIWVTIYALQSITISTELKTLPIYQYIPVIGYFFFKDYSDKFLGTFVGILAPGWPALYLDVLWATIISLHVIAAIAVIIIPIKQKKKKLVYTGVLN